MTGHPVDLIGQCIEMTGDRIKTIRHRIKTTGNPIESIGKRVEMMGDRIQTIGL